jgi:hypothetical protein
MALKTRVYSNVKWVNVWDTALEKSWVDNYLVEYKATWPDIRPEIEPVEKEGEKASCFFLRSLTAGQLHKVDRLSGLEKVCEIVAYGVCGWENMFDGEKLKKCIHTSDDLGQRLTSESVEYLGFFGFVDLGLLQILALQVMQLSRMMK